MIENKYVRVKGIDNAEIVELPLDLDNTLSFAVLSSQFPYSTGLKYRNSKNNQIRTVRRSDEKFFLSPDLNWEDFLFFCFCPQSKRKILENPSEKSFISRKHETLKTIFRKFPETYDLMAIGLSYDTTENNLTEYLMRFGKLMYCKLKYDEIFGYSRGVAHFRFNDIKSQNRCLGATHVVDKTKIIIKIPNEKLNIKESKSSKLYVSNVSNTLTREDIRAYFHQFGHVIHVFMPPDKRNFAFVTFLHDKSIEYVLKEGQTHCFNGARVNVYRVMEKAQLTNVNLSLFVANKDNPHKRKQSIENQDINSNQTKISKFDQQIHSIKSLQFSENSFTSSQLKSGSSTPNLSQPPQIAFPAYNFPPSFSVPVKAIANITQSVPHSMQNLSPSFSPNFAYQLTPNSVQNVNYQGPHSNFNQETLPSEITYLKPDAVKLPMNLNSKSFQSLVIKEIISKCQQQKFQPFQSFPQSEKFNYQLSGKISAENSFMNCNQLENLVNKVCLLLTQSSTLKNQENPIETLLNRQKSQLKIKPNHCDLSLLNDPNIYKALKLLKDSKVLDWLI